MPPVTSNSSNGVEVSNGSLGPVPPEAGGSLTAEPLAIIGIGCRFPGDANGPDQFWKILQDGTDVIREVPEDRWSRSAFYDADGAPGKTHTCQGGFISGIDQFDAEFFGISPREAMRMDPQQRLLLETAWEAIEDAGLVLEKLSGSETGVFIGVSMHDYADLQQGTLNLHAIDTHTSTGLGTCLTANRISYCFNLRGPSLAVDTACSSSLVAVHLACQHLWDRHCTLALAGGVNVLLHPEGFVSFSHLSVLARDGRCKAFDARADGFGRSEGSGIIILKPLSLALRDGDPLYALIRGSACNQDGQTSSLTIPSIEAQTRLIEDACRRAGVNPADVQYMEAHGTGTPVGDPIEARAIAGAVGRRRPAGRPCAIGSVKTNIGHLESGAGIASVVKVALALKHGLIPPSLHFEQPNPHIPLEELNLKVQQTLEPWDERHGPPLAGVNSFGFGGANAHVIMQQAPRTPPRNANGAGSPLTSSTAATAPTEEDGQTDAAPARACLFPMSARSGEALRQMAQSYGEYLGNEGNGSAVSLEDLCWTAGTRRTHHSHRLALVIESKEQLREGLAAFATGETPKNAVTGRIAGAEPPRVVFVCSGQGPQWWAMGRELLHREPIFRATIEECHQLLSGLADWSLMDELNADEGASRMGDTAISQPALFCLQVGLARLWQSWGVQPEAVVGHSVGEVAAAHLAGAFDLHQALRIVFHRGRCMDLAPAEGKMLAVETSPDNARTLIDGLDGAVSLAAVNTADSVTLSGDAEALDEVAKRCDLENIYCKFLRVQYAFHSAKMEPIRAELLESLGDLRPRPDTLPFYSTVEGDRLSGTALDADYWWRNVRQPVQFAPTIDRLLEEQKTAFVELSPHPVLSGYVSDIAQRRSATVMVVPSLRRGEPECATFLKGLGELHGSGLRVDWKGVSAPHGCLVPLPAYPWQHRRHWYEAQESVDFRTGKDFHPLLGRRVTAASPTWDQPLDCRAVRYLADHQVHGQVLLPATGCVEMALAAGKILFGTNDCFVEDVQFVKACFLSPDQATSMQFVFDPQSARFRVCSAPSVRDGEWTEHAHGKLRPAVNYDPAGRVDLEAIRLRCPNETAGAECYTRFRQVGLEFGPAFQGIERLWWGDGEVLGRIVAPPQTAATIDDHRMHPALLDSCFQVVIGIFFSRGAASTSAGLFLPVELEQLRFPGAVKPSLWSHIRLRERTSRWFTVDVTVVDDDGNVVAQIRGYRCQVIDDRAAGAEELDDLVYRYKWRLAQRPDPQTVRASARCFPSTRQICERTQAEDRDLRAGRSRYLASTDKFNALCVGYLVKAFEDLGLHFDPGQRFPSSGLGAALGISPRYERLLTGYLAVLKESGLLDNVEGDWRVRQRASDCASLWKELMGKYPAYLAELTLLRRCGSRLAEILRGDLDPLPLIFPEGSLALPEHFFQDSPSYRSTNLLTARAAELLCKGVPPGTPLRVLEIGAGTGGLSAYLLPGLPEERTHYTFTDLLPNFFPKVQGKFAAFPFVEYRRLDIEQDPVEQGFEAHSYDLVIASECLYATADLKTTLANVIHLLAPEGVLLLREAVKPPLWTTLVFGLTDAWWRFQDVDLRSDGPLLSVDGWRSLLEQLGFVDVGEASGREPTDLENAVILARAPAAPDRTSDGVNGVASAEQAAAPSALQPNLPAEGSWLIFCDQGGCGEKLAQMLEARQQSCVRVFPGTDFQSRGDRRFEISPQSREQVDRLLREAASGLRGVIHCWALDALGFGAADSTTPEEAMRSGPFNAVRLVQALTEQGASAVPRLWLVTRGAQAVEALSETVSPLQAAMWGLGRVIANEAPQLRVAMIDLSADGDDEEVKSLFAEILADGDEDEIALRGLGRFVHRYARSGGEVALQGAPTADEDLSFRLESDRLGTLDSLRLRACPRRKPGPGEIEIEVAAAGLNFVDVMRALNLVPTPHAGSPPFGAECSGVVTAVGEGVVDFRPGDAAVAVGPYSFSAHVIVDARLAAPKPENISHEEAATIPIAFLTSLYALEYLGRMEQGERVLIHAGSGGVGLSAIQIVQAKGGEVFATAGSNEKRDFLRGLGVRHVMDSRSLAFADQVMELTDGQGVDIVLNSLAGQAIDKGLSVLADFGRFIEIGKRDIYADRPLGMKPLRKNLSFLAEDLERLLFVPSKEKRMGPITRLLRTTLEEVGNGRLAPLPHRTFSLAGIVGAFRHMSQARHIGKVVVSFRDRNAPIASAPKEGPLFRPDATYLVTGGLGGFGLVTAEWLARQGAKHLVLLGRSGAHSEEAQKTVEALRSNGVEVQVAQADVSDHEQLAAVLAEVKQTMPPLRGVFHAAMVLEDCLLENLDEELMRRIWAPKVTGAWNLHRLTAGMELDYFVLFSSLASVFGNGGQANYASANAVLDALACYRRAQGLPAVSVNWGYLGQVGWLARHAEIGQRLGARGVLAFTPQQALKLLERFLREGQTNLSVMRMDWRRWGKAFAKLRVPPRFSELVQMGEGEEDLTDLSGAAIRAVLAAGDRAQGVEMLRTLLCNRAAKILGSSPSEIDMDRSLANFGLDSLMAVELRNWIQSELRMNLNTVELMRGPSISQLAEALVTQLEKMDERAHEEVAPSVDVPEQPVAEAPAQPDEDERARLDEVLQEMPEEQLAALLDQANAAESGTR